MAFRTKRAARLAASVMQVALISSCASQSKALRDERSTVEGQSSPITKKSDLPATGSWYSVQFVNNDCAFLAMPKGLYRSLDGGQNWQLLRPVADYEQTIKKIYFFDTKFGWMETNKGWYKSQDGGGTWIWFENPLSSSGRLQDIKFTSRDTGYIAGAVGRPPSREELGSGGVPNVPRYLYDEITKKVLAPSIYRTDDAGKTWHPQAVPGTLGSIEQLSFLNSLQGVALSDHDAIITHNGGVSWTKINDPRDCLTKDEQRLYEGKPSSVYLLDSSLAWIAFSDRRMLRTTDGGKTWREIQPCDQERPTVIHFSSRNRGHGLGSDGFLYETTDGGKEWIKIGADKYQSLSFLDQQHLWLVSEHGIFSLMAAE